MPGQPPEPAYRYGRAPTSGRVVRQILRRVNSGQSIGPHSRGRQVVKAIKWLLSKDAPLATVGKGTALAKVVAGNL